MTDWRLLFADYKESLQQIKIDGLPNIIRSRFLAIKIAWIFIVMASASACLVLTVYTVQDYLRYQVLTTYRIVNEQSSVFPTVIICNLNALNTPQAAALFAAANQTDDASSLWTLDAYVKRTTGSYMNMSQKAALSSFDSVIIKCSFKNRACSAANFSFLLDPNNNHCYRFNAGFDAAGNSVPLEYVDVPGDTEELNIELYTGVSDAQSDHVLARGYSLFVRNQSDFPFSLSPAPVTVSPGFAYDITVRRSFFRNFNQWPYEYSECLVDESGELLKPLADRSLFDAVNNYYSSSSSRTLLDFRYTRNTCYQYCFQLLNGLVFNCTDYYNFFQVNASGSLDFCTVRADDHVTPISESNPGVYARDYCMPRCPQECFQQMLDVSVTSHKYPPSSNYVRSLYAQLQSGGGGGGGVWRAHGNASDYALHLAENMVQFSVFYDKLAYALVEEEARITVVSLIGTFGGQLHVFLGMSLLSFVEVAEMALTFAALFFDKKYKKKKKQQQQQIKSTTTTRVQPQRAW